jgi:acetyltransferase-like isoleucine patch superfamily enzyme
LIANSADLATAQVVAEDGTAPDAARPPEVCFHTSPVELPSPERIWNDGRAVLRARWYLRSATRVGPRVRVWGAPSVTNKGTLMVGDRARLVSTMATLEIGVGPGGVLDIGENVFVNYGCSFGATKSIRIGAHSTIGPHVIMMDNDFHRLEPERRNELPPSAPIVLEENVWLGARVIVLRGVTIGAGSAIGAASVVAGDIPPRTVAAGVPARVIRSI